MSISVARSKNKNDKQTNTNRSKLFVLRFMLLMGPTFYLLNRTVVFFFLECRVEISPIYSNNYHIEFCTLCFKKQSREHWFGKIDLNDAIAGISNCTLQFYCAKLNKTVLCPYYRSNGWMDGRAEGLLSAFEGTWSHCIWELNNGICDSKKKPRKLNFSIF